MNGFLGGATFFLATPFWMMGNSCSMIEFCFGETLPRGVPKGFNLEWGCLLDVPTSLLNKIFFNFEIVNPIVLLLKS
jgi:hypothetical protein